MTACMILLTVTQVNCTRKTEQQKEAERAREHQDRNSAAYKAGKTARELATEAEKAAAAAGRKLDDAARKAREGWREQENEDRNKNQRK
jgi:hypothetical protein